MGYSCSLKQFACMIDLAAKKCVPCNSKDLQAMTEESATEFLLKVCHLICAF
jgi:4a-hydroxytetrahydrobiopterin dehydratase